MGWFRTLTIVWCLFVIAEDCHGLSSHKPWRHVIDSLARMNVTLPAATASQRRQRSRDLWSMPPHPGCDRGVVLVRVACRGVDGGLFCIFGRLVRSPRFHFHLSIYLVCAPSISFSVGIC